ncbi:MAG: metallophosphoesterase [Methanobrevibacter sp.]|uniref:metallophosphoesterase n=1 Tax=Methanobrevibacter sp. TaxID=66852 RepID=UPI0025F567FF|nr:metallophosphoesterase [Methanobrevibacter sp.]MBR3113444.1 metallophosphoesterase [Methanobrevibacter sp.]
MSRRTRRVLFVTPFYMLFEFFLLKYIFLLFGGLNDIYLFVLTVLVGLLHCLPMFFETKKSTFFGRLLTTINGIWMWASVMFLIDIIVIYLIGRFVALPFEVVFGLILIVPILGVYNYYKAHKLIVSEKTLNLDNLTRDIDIAHLSDVHFGSVRHKSIISMIGNKLKELESSCELTIISGDLADGSSVVEENDLMAFKEVNMPIIFTPGNHDFYPGIDNVIKACENAGIIVLDNQRREFGELSVFGLTFSFEDREVPKVDESWINPNMINIINYHVPYHWDEFSELGFDIQLSGHTHGGQFYPVVWIANLMFGYNKGLFKNKFGKYLHVTTGVGSMDTPMRWGTDSEIVILKLRKS